ncbi:hypothetical protein BDB01DRAFT_844390 [Pilobolus umbonatus]|nr:hypothetical protein BDB01DRAFT_844390 [Pilobolus umbonatus]
MESRFMREFSEDEDEDEDDPISGESSSSFYIHTEDHHEVYGTFNPDSVDKTDSYSEEYAVIYDDGTKQRRSVSLSTLPTSSTLLKQKKKKKKYKGNYNYSILNQQDISANISTTYPNSKQERRPLLSTIQSYQNQGDIIHCLQPNSGHSEHHQPITNSYRQLFSLSHKQKMTIKCSIAFLIAILFRFIPQLNDLLGPAKSSTHILVISVLFFNPVKTIGGMIEEASINIIYTLFALFISILSTKMAIYLRSSDYSLVICVIPLISCLALSTFILSYIRAYSQKPSIGASCALGIITFIPVIVKGSVIPDTYDPSHIETFFYSITAGIAISAFVCWFVWPVSAAQKLKSDINESLLSIRILLKVLTKAFLLDHDFPHFTANGHLKAAILSQATSFTALKSSLEDAKKEFYNRDIYQNSKEYDMIVSSLQKLLQHVGGLRNSCGIQFELTKSLPDTPGPVLKRNHSTKKAIYCVKADGQRKKMEYELKKEHSVHSEDGSLKSEDLNEVEDGPLVEFLNTTIIHLQSRFTGQTTEKTPSFDLLRENLSKAISLFESSQQKSLQKFYRRRTGHDNSEPLKMRDIQLHLMDDFPAENVFLVYFFVFCLIEFAQELSQLVACVQSVFESNSDTQPTWIGWIAQKIVDYLCVLCCCFSRKKSQPTSLYEDLDNYTKFQPPQPKTKFHQRMINLHSFLSIFKSNNIRFAIKSTLFSVAIASIAFIPSTRAFFHQWKLEWALIPAITTMSPTLGSTYLVSIIRVLATLAGTCITILIYLGASGNKGLLMFISWLFSLPCFWFILNHKHGRFGIFALFAYAVIIPFMYDQGGNYSSMEMIELACMRAGTISGGAVISILVTIYILPFEARREMRKGLSDLLIQMSWLYKRLVSEYSENRHPPVSPNAKHGSLLKEMIGDIKYEEYAKLCAMSEGKERNEIRSNQFQQMELSLQMNLVNLKRLLADATNEPGLVGPFPAKNYTIMLDSCQSILDKFLSIRIVILKDCWGTQAREELKAHVSTEMMEMAGSILLYFYLLASALKLKTPLPPYLPPAEKAKNSVMIKLRKLPTLEKECHGDNDNSRDEYYMMYYAYALTMENLIKELDQLGEQMKELFGSLISEDQWVQCFGFDIESNIIRS